MQPDFKIGKLYEVSLFNTVSDHIHTISKCINTNGSKSATFKDIYGFVDNQDIVSIGWVHFFGDPEDEPTFRELTEEEYMVFLL